MGYEWYDQIDQIVWDLESMIESACSGKMLGMAPSAGDEARARLRRNASALAPLALMDECEKLKRADVTEASESLAQAAVERALGRGSRHVTREDVGAAIDDSGPFPYLRKD